MARAPAQKKGAAIASPPDPEEQAAVARAAGCLKDLLPGCQAPEAVVYAVVSAWIVERVRLSVGRVLCGEIAYGLGDAHLRGSLEAALPWIGSELAHLPADKPFFELSKDQVVDVLAIGFKAGVKTGALLNDEIPF